MQIYGYELLLIHGVRSTLKLGISTLNSLKWKWTIITRRVNTWEICNVCYSEVLCGQTQDMRRQKTLMELFAMMISNFALVGRMLSVLIHLSNSCSKSMFALAWIGCSFSGNIPIFFKHHSWNYQELVKLACKLESSIASS